MDKRTSTFVLGWAKKIRAIRILGGECIACRQCNPLVIEFHHIDRKTKGWDIGRNLSVKRWSELESEVRKCQLLCRNCHRKIHAFGTDRNLKVKEKLLQIKGTSCCSKCGYSDSIAVLDFHHRDAGNKLFKVNSCDIRRKDIKWEDVLLEIEKTDVLCANCHTITHTNVILFNQMKETIYQAADNHQELQSAINVNIVAKMLSQGIRQIDIAHQLKCAKSTICQIIKRHSLTVVG